MVQGNADTFWRSQRYHLIAEYQERPALAPPFILLSHLGQVLRRVFRKEARRKRARLGEALGRGRAGGAGAAGAGRADPQAPGTPEQGRLCPFPVS